MAYRGEEQTLRQAVAGRCEILDGTQEESVYRTLKLHVESDADVRGVISAVNDAVELRSFREIIPSMNDIFIRAVNGSLLKAVPARRQSPVEEGRSFENQRQTT